MSRLVMNIFDSHFCRNRRCRSQRPFHSSWESQARSAKVKRMVLQPPRVSIHGSHQSNEAQLGRVSTARLCCNWNNASSTNTPHPVFSDRSSAIPYLSVSRTWEIHVCHWLRPCTETTTHFKLLVFRISTKFCTNWGLRHLVALNGVNSGGSRLLPDKIERVSVHIENQ